MSMHTYVDIRSYVGILGSLQLLDESRWEFDRNFKDGYILFNY